MSTAFIPVIIPDPQLAISLFVVEGVHQGIEVMIMDEVEGITGVVDITDHAAGTNPFY